MKSVATGEKVGFEKELEKKVYIDIYDIQQLNTRSLSSQGILNFL